VRAGFDRLTVGKQGSPDFVLSSAAKCAICVLDARILIVPILPLADGSAVFAPLRLPRVDAAWPRLVRSLGLMRRCRAKP
jgi:hypothetical protein